MKQRLRQHDVEMAHLEYLKYSLSIIRKAELTLSLLAKQQPDEPRLENLQYHIAHSRHQIDLIYRRVIEHEQIPHHEKKKIKDTQKLVLKKWMSCNKIRYLD